MKQEFNHLAQIKQVEPNGHLYEKTWRKIERQNVIPLFWVRAVACLLIVVVCAEFYFYLGKQYPSNKGISSVIYQTNNVLYNE